MTERSFSITLVQRVTNLNNVLEVAFEFLTVWWPDAHNHLDVSIS